MAIRRSGVFTETPATGEWAYGVSGLGSLTVDRGDVLTMTSDAVGGPYVRVGQFAGGDATMTITGAGSEVRIDSAGSTISGDGAGMQIGRDGAVGAVNVLAGGALRITDTTSQTLSSNAAEFLYVGRGISSTATLNVSAGSVEVSGSGAALRVGIEGATGSLAVSAGAHVAVISTSRTANHFANFSVGELGSTGSATIDQSSLLVECRGSNEAYFNIGRGGTGTLSITGTGAAAHGLFLHGGSGSFAFADIGRSATGNGTVAVSNAIIRLQNDGNGFDGVAYGIGGNVGMAVGREGGIGSLTLTDNARLALDAARFSTLNLGLGGNGSLSMSAARIDIESTFNSATLTVGRTAGGTGVLSIVNRSTITIDGADAGFLIGYGGGGATGTVTISDSTVRLNGTEDAMLALGTQPPTTSTPGPGTGTLTMVRNAVVEIDGGTGQAGLAVGAQAGGAGTLWLSRGAKIAMVSTGDAEVRIGTDGGTGEVTLGRNSAITGFDLAQIGETSGMTGPGTPASAGLLRVNTGSVFGNAGSVTEIGIGGTLAAGAAVIGGDLELDGGMIDMRAQKLARLDVLENLEFDGGTVRMDIGAVSNDRIVVGGSAWLLTFAPGVAETLFQVRLIEGRVLTAGETVTLVYATAINTAFGSAAFDAEVSGAGRGFDFAFGISATQPNRLVLTALNASDSTIAAPTGALNLAGPLAVQAIHGPAEGDWSITGGAWVTAVAKTTGPVSGTRYDDTIDGSLAQYALQLQGNRGHDSLRGGNGNDTLTGGAGRDTMSGGSGADVFVFSSASDSGATRAKRDVIEDFTSGVDLVDLTAFGPGLNFIGADAFSGAEGEVRFDGRSSQLQVDLDGGADAEVSVLLIGVSEISGTDLLLV